MELSMLIDLLTGAAVVAGLVFAAYEVRQFRKSRARESAFQLFQTFQSMEFSIGTRLMFDMPDGLSKAELYEYLGDDLDYFLLLLSSLEGLGVLVQQKEISLKTVEDFFSGLILSAWKKIERYVREIRELRERETIYEYIQWLAERIIEKENTESVVPAYVEFADWKE